MASYGQCEFGHDIRTDIHSVITLPRVNDVGATVWDTRTGEDMRTTERLPFHIVPRSAFDATGLVPALCEHGLEQHPNGLERKVGRSWIRSRYVNGDRRKGTIGRCVVCLGEPTPDDLT